MQERLERQASSPVGQGHHDVIRAGGLDDLGQLVERAEPRSLCGKTLFGRLIVDDTDHDVVEPIGGSELFDQLGSQRSTAEDQDAGEGVPVAAHPV